jgi:dihydrolipoamide dehydrogenase
MQYDVIIIGSGPGGYVSAIRCAQLGLKTAIIEKYNSFGGTCLNVGCIPSKALLDSSEHYHNAANAFESHGIKVGSLKVDMKQMIARKNDVVAQNTAGIQFLFKKNKITAYQGVASFVDKNTLKVTNEAGESQQLTAKKHHYCYRFQTYCPSFPSR